MCLICFVCCRCLHFFCLFDVLWLLPLRYTGRLRRMPELFFCVSCSLPWPERCFGCNRCFHVFVLFCFLWLLPLSYDAQDTYLEGTEVVSSPINKAARALIVKRCVRSRDFPCLPDQTWLAASFWPCCCSRRCAKLFAATTSCRWCSV